MQKILIPIALLILLAVGGFYIFTTRDTADEQVGTQNSTTNQKNAEDFLPLGKWESLEDEKFIRVFDENSYQDQYEGKTISTGTWRTFDSSDAPEVETIEFIAGVNYLVLDEGTEDVLYFSIAKSTKEELALIYLNRGGVLEFKNATTKPNQADLPTPKDPTKDDTVQKECFVSGCSGQLCTSKPGLASTCEWREEYACYKEATCEVQPSGQCGWTQTTELQACLAQ